MGDTVVTNPQTALMTDPNLAAAAPVQVSAPTQITAIENIIPGATVAPVPPATAEANASVSLGQPSAGASAPVAATPADKAIINGERNIIAGEQLILDKLDAMQQSINTLAAASCTNNVTVKTLQPNAAEPVLGLSA